MDKYFWGYAKTCWYFLGGKIQGQMWAYAAGKMRVSTQLWSEEHQFHYSSPGNQVEYIPTPTQSTPSTPWPELSLVSNLNIADSRHSRVQMLEATMTWWWWLSRHALRVQGNQPSQESGLTSRSWMIQQWWVLSRQVVDLHLLLCW